MAVSKNWWKPPSGEMKIRILPPYPQPDNVMPWWGWVLALAGGSRHELMEGEPMAATEPIRSAYEIERDLLFKLGFVAPENVGVAGQKIIDAIQQINGLIAKCVCRTGVCAECEYNKSVLERVQRMRDALHPAAPAEIDEEEEPDAINRIVDEEPYEVDEQG